MPGFWAWTRPGRCVAFTRRRTGVRSSGSTAESARLRALGRPGRGMIAGPAIAAITPTTKTPIRTSRRVTPASLVRARRRASIHARVRVFIGRPPRAHEPRKVTVRPELSGSRSSESTSIGRPRRHCVVRSGSGLGVGNPAGARRGVCLPHSSTPAVPRPRRHGKRSRPSPKTPPVVRFGSTSPSASPAVSEGSDVGVVRRSREPDSRATHRRGGRARGMGARVGDTPGAVLAEQLFELVSWPRRAKV